MSGFGSLVRTVDLVLRKLIFCVPEYVFRRYAAKRKEVRKINPATSRHRNKETFSFYEVPKVSRRGAPSMECNGKLVVSSRLEKVPNGSEGKEVEGTTSSSAPLRLRSVLHTSHGNSHQQAQGCN